MDSDAVPGPDERAASPAPLEFEPEAVRPAPAAPVAAAVARRPTDAAGAARGTPVAPTPGRRFLLPRASRSVVASLLIHAGLFCLFLVFVTRPEPPEAPDTTRVTVRLEGWHWVGDDPEADGTGPRGPDPPAPPPKGEEKAPGFLADDTATSAATGVGRAAAGSVYAGRLDGREGALASGGGDGGTEGAVRLALSWLARHQEADGTWRAARFARRCEGPACTGAAPEDHDTAVTALALLPFLGAGHTHRDGPWKDVVRKGLAALRERQRPDGHFDDTAKRAYADAMATLAVCEAYGLTGNEDLGDMARRAAGFFTSTQNDEGGWRYAIRDRDADSSVTGWVGTALASARRAGVAVPDAALARCRAFLAGRTDDEGFVGYTARGTGPRSLLGVGYAVPVLLGLAPDDPSLAKTGARLDTSLPRWSEDPSETATFGTADPLHWYYGGLAAFQRGGATWKVWNERLRTVLLPHQAKSGCAAGSWDPVGQTGVKGGRVVVTALGALALEVYYRYPRVTARR